MRYVFEVHGGAVPKPVRCKRIHVGPTVFHHCHQITTFPATAAADRPAQQVLERNMKRMAAESALQSQRRLAEINERRAARGASSIEQARKERDTAGHPVVRLVESKGWDDFGFMLFRMDYSDDARWERFMEVYDQMLESSMDEAEAGSGIERIRDKLFTKFVDDDIVDGSGVVGVARFVL